MIQWKEQVELGRRKDQVWRYGQSEARREDGYGETEAKEMERQTFTKAAPQDTSGSFVCLQAEVAGANSHTVVALLKPPLKTRLF